LAQRVRSEPVEQLASVGCFYLPYQVAAVIDARADEHDLGVVIADLPIERRPDAGQRSHLGGAARDGGGIQRQGGAALGFDP
jgi:hypothetical protein